MTTTQTKTVRFTEVSRSVGTEVVNGVTMNVLYEFGMYATKGSFYTTITVKGKVIREFVEMNVYGLLVWVIREHDGEFIKEAATDFGVLSAHPRHVNSFIHSMCRMGSLNLNGIKDALDLEYTSWCDGWDDPFSQEASKLLTRKMSSPTISKITESILIRSNHMEKMRKNNPFRGLPYFNQNTGGYNV